VSCQGGNTHARRACRTAFGATAAGEFWFVLRNSFGTSNVPNLFRAKTVWSCIQGRRAVLNPGLCRAVCLSEMVGDARMCNYEGDYTSAAKVVMTVGSYKLCTIATFSVRGVRCTRRPCLGGLDLRSSGTDCGVRPGRGAGEARGGTLLACG